MTAGDLKFDWPPLGQDKAAAFLEKSILSGRLSQAYIFSGPSELGKSSLALAFARNIWQHDRKEKFSSDDFSSLNSDLYIIKKEPGKKQIGIETIRGLIHDLGMSSFLDSYKIAIIKEAESLSIEAQNALLKTLEEAKEKTIIILLSSDSKNLLPTIASRSQLLYFYPVSSDTVYDYLLSSDLDLKRSNAKELAALSLGRPLKAKRLAEDKEAYEENRALAQRLIDFLAAPLPERLAILEEKGPGGKGEENAEVWLETFEGLLRDALLFSLGQNEHLQYPAWQDKWPSIIGEALNSESSVRALESLRYLRQAQEYLKSFLSPKNILESLAIYL